MHNKDNIKKLHTLHTALLKVQEDVKHEKDSATKTMMMQQILRLQREYNEVLEQARTTQKRSLS